MKKEKTKGIVIYALGHNNYYHMAEVLAASLIVNGAKDDGIGIALICDDKTKIIHPKLFDKTIKLSKERFTKNGKVIFNHATVLVYDLSPFDETIKLDADMVWIAGRNPSDLLQSLEDVDLSFENIGHDSLDKADRKRSVWAEPAEIKEVYNFTGEERCYTIFGEFIYFKKTKENRSFFSKVKSIYKEAKVKCANFSNGIFTDELAFQIAIMQTEKYPHKDHFTPVFNLFLHRKDLHGKHSYQLPANFYAYSIGGNNTPGWQKQQYNILANHYFRKLGLQNPFQATDKKRYLPERIKL